MLLCASGSGEAVDELPCGDGKRTCRTHIPVTLFRYTPTNEPNAHRRAGTNGSRMRTCRQPVPCCPQREAC